MKCGYGTEKWGQACNMDGQVMQKKDSNWKVPDKLVYYFNFLYSSLKVV